MRPVRHKASQLIPSFFISSVRQLSSKCRNADAVLGGHIKAGLYPSVITPGIPAHILDTQNALAAEERKKVLKVIAVSGDFLGHGDPSLDGAGRAFDLPAGDGASIVKLIAARTENLVTAHLVIGGRVLLGLAGFGLFLFHL